MRRQRLASFVLVLVFGVMALAACGSTGNTGNSGTTPTVPATATTAPKPTAITKPKPTKAPTLSAQYCQNIMPVSQANSIMKPATAATSIQFSSTSDAEACNYLPSPSSFPVVSVLFLFNPYTGPVPVPESTITGFVTTFANKPGVKVTTATPVSGVGDQAEFLAFTATQGNLTLSGDAFYVLDGNVVFMCDDFHLGAAFPDAAQMAALKQCAQLFVAAMGQ